MREQALKWWRAMTDEEQRRIVEKHQMRGWTFEMVTSSSSAIEATHRNFLHANEQEETVVDFTVAQIEDSQTGS
jgi:hypothetical protein